MGGGGEQDVNDGLPDGVPVAEALDDMLAGDDSGLCAGLLDLLALLSDVGAARWLLRRAGRLALVAAPGGYGFQEPFAAEVIDAALGELAEAGLVITDEAEFEEADDDDGLDDVAVVGGETGAGEPGGREDRGAAGDAGDEDDEDDENPDDVDDYPDDVDGEELDEDDLDDSAFDTVTVDPEAGRIIRARRVTAATLAELGARACALLDEAARSGAPIDYALLADGMTACWDELLPHLGAADDELVKDLLEMRGRGLSALMFYAGDSEYSDVSEAGMIEFGEKLVADYELALGPGDPDAWETRRNMARIYGWYGRFDEAIAVFARLRADMERALPADDDEILVVRADLANGYLNAGRYPEAVRAYTELVADCERALGGANSLTLSMRGSLGGAYLETGRVFEGIQLMEAAAAGLEDLFGPDAEQVVFLREAIAGARGQTAG